MHTPAPLPRRRRSVTLARTLVMLAAVAAVGLVSSPVPAAAQDRTCTGAIGADTVENLDVPSGASCSLDGTVVEGNIVVGGGATLGAANVRVDGNIQAEGHARVTVGSSTVGGNIQVEQGAAAEVRGTRIDGDLQYFSNSGALVAVDNTIGGNLQAEGNRGGLDVTGNTIDGDLQCQGNDPAPTGGANVVRGSAEGQCAGLTGPPSPPPPPGGGRFCDTAGHTHERSIDAVAAAGVAQGGTDGCYRPDEPVSRGQMATFIARGYDLAAGAANFCDTAGHTHEASIGAVAAAGIASGGADGCFRPNDAVTRGQLATFLANAEGLTAQAANFCDTAGHTHEGSIGAVAAAGIASGGADGCYRPNDPVTRGQMATFIARALGL